MDEVKIKLASASMRYEIGDEIGDQLIVPGFVTEKRDNAQMSYKEQVKHARRHYAYDPIASVVINRISEMSITKMRHKRYACSDEELWYYIGISQYLTSFLEAAAREYLITGMVVPAYLKGKKRGDLIDPRLGRTVYTFPDKIWVRNIDNIVLKRTPMTLERLVYFIIPQEDVDFIINNGVFSDGTSNKEAYQMLKKTFPDYVAAVKRGDRQVYIPDANPIFRKLMTHLDYPQPFLTPALSSLDHKQRLKRMDRAIADHVIEAVMHIKIGSDEFPLEDGDSQISDLREQLSNRGPNSASLYQLITNHVTDIKWIYPPIEALLSDSKYVEANADIFMAIGFSRLLLVGESQRSNSGGAISTLGPLSTLEEMRRNMLRWVKDLYVELAELNGFKHVPEPMFAPIPSTDMAALVQYAVTAMEDNAISRDTLANMFGSDFESELPQIEYEADALKEILKTQNPVLPTTPKPAPKPIAPATTPTKITTKPVTSKPVAKTTKTSKAKAELDDEEDEE